MVLEYAGSGMLFDFIERGLFGEDYARLFAHQLLNSLSYLHKKGYAHRDLKPDNIFIDSQMNLKLGDFGSSCVQNGNELNSPRGTETYMAPEVNEGAYNGAQADCFSLGVVLFVMAHGLFPFQKASLEDPYY